MFCVAIHSIYDLNYVVNCIYYVRSVHEETKAMPSPKLMFTGPDVSDFLLPAVLETFNVLPLVLVDATFLNDAQTCADLDLVCCYSIIAFSTLLPQHPYHSTAISLNLQPPAWFGGGCCSPRKN
jgi:hypothetical protein